MGFWDQASGAWCIPPPAGWIGEDNGVSGSHFFFWGNGEQHFNTLWCMGTFLGVMCVQESLLSLISKHNYRGQTEYSVFP